MTNERASAPTPRQAKAVRDKKHKAVLTLIEVCKVMGVDHLNDLPADIRDRLPMPVASIAGAPAVFDTAAVVALWREQFPDFREGDPAPQNDPAPVGASGRRGYTPQGIETLRKSTFQHLHVSKVCKLFCCLKVRELPITLPAGYRLEDGGSMHFNKSEIFALYDSWQAEQSGDHWAAAEAQRAAEALRRYG